MAYSSDINLPLAQEPKTSDMNVWPDFLDVYNSIHILAQLIDRIRQGSGDANTDPWDAMPFERYFYSPAAEKIEAGSVVTIVDMRNAVWPLPPEQQYVGVVKGAPAYAGFNFSASTNSGYSNKSFGTGLIGIALSDCEKDEKCQIGVGPAIMKIEGTQAGDTIMAATFLKTPIGSGLPGQVAINDAEFRGQVSKGFIPFDAMVVGYGVAKDAVLITPFLDYKADLEARAGYNASSAPPFDGG